MNKQKTLHQKLERYYDSAERDWLNSKTDNQRLHALMIMKRAKEAMEISDEEQAWAHFRGMWTKV